MKCMKKNVAMVMAACVLTLTAGGCGKNADENAISQDGSEFQVAGDTENASSDGQESQEATAEVSYEETTGEEVEYPYLPLPDYHYCGTEDYAEYADYVCQYLIDEVFGDTEADLKVCVPMVVKVDDSDPSDVKVWGENELYTFTLINTTLQSEMGGAYGGLAHIDTTGDTPKVTEMEYVENGSSYDPSVDRIFGAEGLKDAYLQACDNSKESLTQALSDYVNQNGIYITQYQQYGWPPVSLINAPATRDEDQIVYYVGNAGFTTQFDMRQICAMEMDKDETFASIICEEWNDFLIEIYLEDDTDIENAIKNIRSNLYDESAELTRTDDVPFNDITGCTRLMSEGPYKDGDHVYVNYIIPRQDSLFVIKMSSIYSEDENKQMATDGIIEAFLGSMELK